MFELKRTANCGQLGIEDMGRTVTLNGWVHRIRNHGGIYFINLRDRYGNVQLVVDEQASSEVRAIGEKLKMEFCIAVRGTVRPRPQNMVNKDMQSGAIELAPTKLKVLNSCPPLPFVLDGEDEANENLRLQYRYLDLRTQGMQQRLKLRHECTWALRKYLNECAFWEIETPTLIRSTPEGARDYLVPSRINPGHFYALPQSPQLYKQILMAGGIDRYYQLARCYRDEDARGDRQPEFTQVDLEMSFVGRDDVLTVAEGMMARIFKEILDIKIPIPFKRLSWQETMENYGTDKPDLRFGLEFTDFSPFVASSNFSMFKKVLHSGGTVKAILAPGAAMSYSRKKIAETEEVAKSQGAEGLAWMRVSNEGLEGGVSKFFTGQASKIITELEAEAGDLILIIGADREITLRSLCEIRNRVGSNLGLIEANSYSFCWIIDFPLFEKNPESDTWKATHHIFSKPQDKFLDRIEDNPGEVIGDLYDLVLNGNEIASGSVRIHEVELQKRVLKLLGFPEAQARKRFGFLLDALSYGAPPHAGIAIGFDRLMMIIAQKNTIREVIAFPKNTQGISPMDRSPSTIDENQLTELYLSSMPH
ncbi:Aspartyl-tRNA synthetase [Olavius algarvensis spirochete endosymbiont]|uniref:aspartate--tRNA ligase n=1 Tax=Olavius algarvensis spirochete endosymbiont TaxID=260710 RepID=UPI00052E0F4A|nr:aspartate--tRNA ligase [Olavius algarvensis spirochete endosymbiont]KGM38604.1 aspartate--tRNA ligase [Alkalispirochaeta odontotermitis]CAD7838304.1 MAG: Aspartyl-tRNA synthetase (EC 6.1.1.12) [Olavius algarvensis spirochete endosymbiont]VDB00046.1 Aspartyl-tRNA synthetase [Olavius algarvensis spirochete endosymbiont]